MWQGTAHAGQQSPASRHIMWLRMQHVASLGVCVCVSVCQSPWSSRDLLGGFDENTWSAKGRL